ncbi:sodium-dependent phosphate transport protein 1, chloroplastic [Haematococcus lacustris]
MQQAQRCAMLSMPSPVAMLGSLGGARRIPGHNWHQERIRFPGRGTPRVHASAATPTPPPRGSGSLSNPITKQSSEQCAPPAAATGSRQAAHLDEASEVVLPAWSSPSAAAVMEAAVPGWQQRWTIVAMCFVAFILCNMDRVNMAVAILPMREQFGWSTATVGLVQSSFFMGYLVTQIFGGIWADRYGGKLVLGFGVLWWSAATALTPWAAQAGLPVLLFTRAVMGIGEGVAMPAMNNMLSRWVPVKERSRSLALVYSGMFLGSAIGLCLSPKMIVSLGWPSVFWSFGSLGIVWAAVWKFLASSNPAKCPLTSSQERSYILANTLGADSIAPGTHSPPSTSVTTKAASGAVAVEGGADGVAAGAEGGSTLVIPWRALLSRSEVWAIIVCHFCHNWGTFILLTWMPTYYNQVLGLDLTKSAVLSVLPWLTMALMSNVGGWLADSAVERGVSVTTVRKVMQSIGFLGPALFLSQLSGVQSVTAAVLCMMGAQGCDAFSQSGLYSNHQDIAPRYAGVLLGLSNTAGVLAGVLGSLATGFILQHGSWEQVWQVAIALYLVGTLVWNTWASGERIFD